MYQNPFPKGPPNPLQNHRNIEEKWLEKRGNSRARLSMEHARDKLRGQAEALKNLEALETQRDELLREVAEITCENPCQVMRDKYENEEKTNTDGQLNFPELVHLFRY